MTIQTYLAAISLGAIAVSFTAVFGALTAVISYYSYKWASGMIRNRTKHLSKIKKHKMFKGINPTISMVKQKRTANGKI
jgi:hypothetical protein